jgi:hypothetical protein
MRPLLLGIIGFALSLFAFPAAAQAPEEIAIRSVISRQLAAFNRDDTAAAFALASPGIQKHFGDAATFAGMVERSFPQIRRSRSHRFLKFEIVEDKVIQRVLIQSDAGTVIARYEMIGVDGTWRINGCAVEKADGA